jgi:hypothetical protein
MYGGAEISGGSAAPAAAAPVDELAGGSTEPAEITGGSTAPADLASDVEGGKKEYKKFGARSTASRSRRLSKECPAGKARNPMSGRCKIVRRKYTRRSTLTRAMREGKALFRNARGPLSKPRCPSGMRRSKEGSKPCVPK